MSQQNEPYLMKNTSFYNEVIQAIEKLYSSITLRILQKRMDSYHSASANNNANSLSFDFTASLYKYIDDVSSQTQKTVPDKQMLDHAGFSISNNPHPPSHFEITYKGNNSGLTKHFKEINNAELHPGISGKMKDSIWEHIHASIRHARQGNSHAAKVHADIANNAYKELAHYISSEEYNELAREIEDQFDALVSNK